MEVGLSKWLIGPSKTIENMYEIRWPKKEYTVPTFIQKKSLPESDWTTETVVIKRRCVTWIKARDALNNLCDDSNYESEIEFGRGLRKKKPNSKFQFSDSDTEREMLKQTTMKIAPPPPVRKCNPSVASTKDSTTQKSAANARVNRQNDSNQERLKQIACKITNARKVVAEKMQKSVALGNSDKSSLPCTSSSSTLPLVSSNADDGRSRPSNATVTAVNISRNNSNYDKIVLSQNSLSSVSFASSSKVADAMSSLNPKQIRCKVRSESGDNRPFLPMKNLRPRSSSKKPSATVVVDTPLNLSPQQEISLESNVSDNKDAEYESEDLGQKSSSSINNCAVTDWAEDVIEEGVMK